ncbi:hypothetical protein B0A49_13908, partial [Cryomyces minteri]
MAPYLQEQSFYQTPTDETYQLATPNKPRSAPTLPAVSYEPGRTIVESHVHYEYEELRPTFPDVHWEPLIEVATSDRGIDGDPKFRNLLAEASDVFDYTPKIGTEIHGINLARLTDPQKNDLARLIATRGVVFFRGQTDFDIDTQ